MGKSNSGNNRGRRKINSDDSVILPTRQLHDGKLDCEGATAHDNVNKASKKSKILKSKIPIAENRERGVGASPGTKYSKRHRSVEETEEGITANFEEEGKQIQLKITPNEAKEFASKTEEESSDNEDTEEEMETQEEFLKSKEQDTDSEVCIKRYTPEELEKAEEKEMFKFVEFMRKQGLVMVQSASSGKGNDIGRKAATNTPKTRNVDKGRTDEISDNNSMVTIYQNAVNPASKENKWDSSSSDEPMDTSDESQVNLLGNDQLEDSQVNQFVTEYVAVHTPVRHGKEAPVIHEEEPVAHGSSTLSNREIYATQATNEGRIEKIRGKQSTHL